MTRHISDRPEKFSEAQSQDLVSLTDMTVGADQLLRSDRLTLRDVLGRRKESLAAGPLNGQDSVLGCWCVTWHRVVEVEGNNILRVRKQELLWLASRFVVVLRTSQSAVTWKRGSEAMTYVDQFAQFARFPLVHLHCSILLIHRGNIVDGHSSSTARSIAIGPEASRV